MESLFCPQSVDFGTVADWFSALATAVAIVVAYLLGSRAERFERKRILEARIDDHIHALDGVRTISVYLRGRFQEFGSEGEYVNHSATKAICDFANELSQVRLYEPPFSVIAGHLLRFVDSVRTFVSNSEVFHAPKNLHYEGDPDECISAGDVRDSLEQVNARYDELMTAIQNAIASMQSGIT